MSGTAALRGGEAPPFPHPFPYTHTHTPELPSGKALFDCEKTVTLTLTHTEESFAYCRDFQLFLHHVHPWPVVFHHLPPYSHTNRAGPRHKRTNEQDTEVGRGGQNER